MVHSYSQAKKTQNARGFDIYIFFICKKVIKLGNWAVANIDHELNISEKQRSS